MQPLLQSSPHSAAPRPATLPSARYKGGCVAADFVSSAEGSGAGRGAAQHDGGIGFAKQIYTN